MVLPCASVMVIVVLLNDAFTCATPDAMFLRSRRRTRVASLPILDPFTVDVADATPSSQIRLAKKACGLLFLAGDRLGRPLAGTRIGVRALPAHRQTAA